MAYTYKGPFFMFMVETRKRLEARGERFSGYGSVVSIAGDLWEKMSSEQKDEYRQKSIEYKKSKEYTDLKLAARANRGNRRNEKRSPPADQDAYVEEVMQIYPSDDEEARAEFNNQRKKDQDEICRALKWNMVEGDAICKEPFYVISFLHHGRTNAYKYFPAEVAVIEFTLADGIRSGKSFVLGPHFLPADLVDAKLMESLHKIPGDKKTPEMTNDFEEVMAELINSRVPNRGHQFFCISSEFNATQGCMGFLKSATKNNTISSENIKCVEDLFVVLCRWKDKIASPAERRAFAEDCDGRSGSIMSTWKGIFCSYHTHFGVEFCALATAKRACYYLLQYFQRYYGYSLTENHRPPIVDSASKPRNVGRRTTTRATVDGGRGPALNQQALAAAAAATEPEQEQEPMLRPRMADDDTKVVKMPMTLPTQLQAVMNSKLAPPNWSGGQSIAAAVGVVESDQKSVYDATTFVRTAPGNIQWGQNQQFRAGIYGSTNTSNRKVERLGKKSPLAVAGAQLLEAAMALNRKREGPVNVGSGSRQSAQAASKERLETVREAPPPPPKISMPVGQTSAETASVAAPTGRGRGKPMSALHMMLAQRLALGKLQQEKMNNECQK